MESFQPHLLSENSQFLETPCEWVFPVISLFCAGWVCGQASVGCLFQPTVRCASVGPARQLLCFLSLQPGCQCDWEKDGDPPLGQPRSRWATWFAGVFLSSLSSLTGLLALSLKPENVPMGAWDVTQFCVLCQFCLFFFNMWLLHNPWQSKSHSEHPVCK